MITAGDGWSLAATLLVVLWLSAGWGPAAAVKRGEPSPWAWTAFLGASLGLLLTGLGLAALSGIGLEWSSVTVWSLAAVLAIPGAPALRGRWRGGRASGRLGPAEAVAVGVAAGAALLFA
ncbi:MAG: hypothetical protein AAGF23_23490, partial [Acidobacteriota bacterium]